MDRLVRRANLKKFRNGEIDILISTDLASRGLDFENVDRVINYHLPQEMENYLHRVGRTARANSKGEAFTLVNPKDMHRIQKIEKLIESEIPKMEMPEAFGPAPEYKVSNHGGGGKRKFYNKF
jgi:superfamily II DNA/RNA helicase